MPQGGQAVPIGPCPNTECRGTLISMRWKDGFGGEEIEYERHCSRCGFTADPEGKVIRQSYWHEKQLRGKEN